MELDRESCYRALTSRDPRFDGVFFTGVVTTGVYCRPVCPARRPAASRCRFFPSAAAAEDAGFRPCLRCRPERAPSRAIVDATSRLARGALARIAAGALNEGSVEELAAALHTSPRQLRRAVSRESGASPVQLAQTHRLLLAKQLLMETPLPVTRVAFAAGFGSVRRMNALFRERYRMSPSRLRRDRGAGSGLTLRLDYRPPFDWQAHLDFLALRAVPGVEAVVGGRYLRTAAVGGARGWLGVAPAAGSVPALRVDLSPELLPALLPVLAGLRRLFDLDAEPHAVDPHLARDPALAPLVARRPGLRIPGAFDPFETALRAVLGQQISVQAATTLTGRVARRFGEPAAGLLPDVPGGLALYGPTPQALASADPDDVAELGMPRTRARTVVALARAVAGGQVRLDPGAPPEATLEALLALPGIGPWTAEYVALRALHWPDAFPHGDLGLRRALGDVTATEALAAAERWRPWRGYAALHLWAAAAAPTTTTARTNPHPKRGT